MQLTTILRVEYEWATHADIIYLTEEVHDPIKEFEHAIAENLVFEDGIWIQSEYREVFGNLEGVKLIRIIHFLD